MNKKYLIALIIGIIVIGGVYFAFANNQTSTLSLDASALEQSGNIIVNNTEENHDSKLFSASKSDLNSILVTNNGKLKLTNSIVNKTGDTSSSGDDADFYGINSAVLVNSNGSLDISNVEIFTNSKGSNGIFVTNSQSGGSSSQTEGGEVPDSQGQNNNQPPEAPANNTQTSGKGAPADSNQNSQPPEAPSNNTQTSGEGAPADSNQNSQPPEAPADNTQAAGEGAPDNDDSSNEGTTEANIKNVKITTYKDKSRGLDATYNGIINADNVEINTNGGSCAALATDRGEGQVHVSNSKLNTGVDKKSGAGSPLIYSTGNITVSNSKGTAYVSQIACIEGKNSIELTDCDLSGYGQGNRQDNGNYVDLGGIFIYQSMSGDADVGTSTFTAKNSKLSICEESDYYKTSPMFHVTNTAGVINLENSEITFGSGVFLNISGQNQWGNEGSNGGNVELNTNSEEINGDIFVDSISSLLFNMKNTQFKGSINSDGNTTLNISSDSTWTLTGDSSVSDLNNEGNIDYGEYTLTVNGKEYTSSNKF